MIKQTIGRKLLDCFKQAIGLFELIIRLRSVCTYGKVTNSTHLLQAVYSMIEKLSIVQTWDVIIVVKTTSGLKTCLFKVMTKNSSSTHNFFATHFDSTSAIYIFVNNHQQKSIDLESFYVLNFSICSIPRCRGRHSSVQLV